VNLCWWVEVIVCVVGLVWFVVASLGFRFEVALFSLMELLLFMGDCSYSC
jgi:hypothetical protein